MRQGMSEVPGRPTLVLGRGEKNKVKRKWKKWPKLHPEMQLFYKINTMNYHESPLLPLTCVRLLSKFAGSKSGWRFGSGKAATSIHAVIWRGLRSRDVGKSANHPETRTPRNCAWPIPSTTNARKGCPPRLQGNQGDVVVFLDAPSRL